MFRVSVHHFKLPVDLRLVTMIVPSSKFSSRLGLSRDDRRPNEGILFAVFQGGPLPFRPYLEPAYLAGDSGGACGSLADSDSDSPECHPTRSRRPRGTSELGTPAPGPIIGYDDMGRQLTSRLQAAEPAGRESAAIVFEWVGDGQIGSAASSHACQRLISKRAYEQV